YRDARPQRPSVVREKFQRLFQRLHDSVELKRAPEKAHGGRDKLVAFLLRRDEVSDLAGQLAHIGFDGLVSRHWRADVKPQLQTQLGGTGANKLPRRRALLISRARRRGHLIRKTHLQRFRIELHLAVLVRVDLVLELRVEFVKFGFFEFERIGHFNLQLTLTLMECRAWALSATLIRTK